MAQKEENGGNFARFALAVLSPVIVAAGFFVFPFLPAICAWLDGRSRTYTAAACAAIGCAALPVLLGPHGYALAAFIAITTAAVCVLARVKVPFSTGLVSSAAGGVLGAVVALGLLGAGFDRPLNELGASYLCNGLSYAAHAGYPDLLSYLAGTVKAADQGDYVGLFSIFNLFNMPDLLALVSGLSTDEQIAVVRPLLEDLCAAYIPAFSLVGGMFVGAVGYYLPVLALDRRRRRLSPAQPAAEEGEAETQAPVPPFAAFKVPRYIVITLLLLQIASSFMLGDAGAGLAALSVASSLLFGALMTVQALSLLSFFLNRKRVHAAAQFPLLALAVLLFFWILPYVGIVDALFDIRAVTLRMDAIRAKGKQVFTQEGLDELRRMEQRRRSGRNGDKGDGGEDGKE
jgi:hypothetical protein